MMMMKTIIELSLRVLFSAIVLLQFSLRFGTAASVRFDRAARRNVNRAIWFILSLSTQMGALRSALQPPSKTINIRHPLIIIFSFDSSERRKNCSNEVIISPSNRCGSRTVFFLHETNIRWNHHRLQPNKASTLMGENWKKSSGEDRRSEWLSFVWLNPFGHKLKVFQQTNPEKRILDSGFSLMAIELELRSHF